jgi:hypothetical protein
MDKSDKVLFLPMTSGLPEVRQGICLRVLHSLSPVCEFRYTMYLHPLRLHGSVPVLLAADFKCFGFGVKVFPAHVLSPPDCMYKLPDPKGVKIYSLGISMIIS